MTSWVNRAVFQVPQDGTAATTITPSSATNLVSGTAFTPTAGRLLVVVMEGSITSTGTAGGTGTTAPAGWSGGAAASGFNAVSNTGLYLFYKTAAGSDTLTAFHNGSNYQVIAAVYEFPAGSTIASVAATGIALTAANPNLTGLTGTNSVFGVVAGGYGSTSTLVPPSVTWSGTGTPTKDVDAYTPKATTDGYVLSIGYVDGATGASWQPTGSMVAGDSGAPNKETLTFAVKLGSGGNSYTASPTEAVGITDSVTAAISSAGAAVVSDPVGITDSVTASIVRSLVVSLNDGIGITDTGNPIQVSITYSMDDPVGLSDSVSAVLKNAAGAVVVSLSDSVGLSDSVSAVLYPAGVTANSLSAADLEIAWLRRTSGILTPMSLADLRWATYGGTEYAYFSTRSGLSSGSLADHKLAYFKAQTGLTNVSLIDAARSFWAQ